MNRSTRRPATRWATLAAVAALLLVAAVVTRATGDHENPGKARTPNTAVAPSDGGPEERPPATDPGDAGRPGATTGAQQAAGGGEQDAAVDAAVGFVGAAQQWLYLDDADIAAAVSDLASPGSAVRLAEDAVADVRAAREELALSPGRVWWLVHPLAWRVDSFADGEATISVWSVTLLSAAEVAVPQTEWVTVTLDLVLVAGEWRVDGVRERPGPTPMTGPQDQPWEPEPFDTALDGFTRMDGKPVR